MNEELRQLRIENKLLREEKELALQDSEKYRMQMAAICTAAIGYWTEYDSISPDYDTLALRDVAKLYAKYDALYKAQQLPVCTDVSVDAVDTLTEEGWIWDGDQWQRPPEPNQFKPDYNTEAVLVEEMQRMAKRIEDLEAMLTRQTARIVELQEHIENFDGEDR